MTSETRAQDTYRNEYAGSRESIIQKYRLPKEATENYYSEDFQYQVIYTLLFL